MSVKKPDTTSSTCGCNFHMAAAKPFKAWAMAVSPVSERLAEQAAFLVGEQIRPVIENQAVVEVELEGLLAQFLQGLVVADETVMHGEARARGGRSANARGVDSSP